MATPDIFAPTKSAEALDQDVDKKADTGLETEEEPEKSKQIQGITAKVREAADPVKIK